MADGITLNSGTGGAVLSTDDIASVHYQIVKLALGALDSATLATGGNGNVDAGTLRVTIAADTTGVLSVDDNGSTLSIDDGAGSLTVDNGGTFAVQVDAAIPAGTNNIGDVDVASIAAGDNNIGNVDIVTLPTTVHSADYDTDAGTDTTLAFGIAVPAAGGAAVVPGDATAGLKVNLGADNDVTVTGTVDLGATDNAVLDAIAASTAAADTDLTTIIGHVDGLEGLLTTIDADTGGILTSVQLIDDAVQVLGTDTYTETTSKGITLGAVRRDADTTLVNTTNEFAPLQVDANGRLKVEAFSGETLPVSGTVTANLAAGTNNIGDVDVLSIAAGTNSIGNVGLIGRTSGGMTIFRSLDLDETEEEIKATAGQVFSITAFNETAAPLYLKFYNATAANVTVGSTTPVLTFMVPGNADSDGAGFVWNNEIGFAFATAITAACTTGIADADTGAPGANDCMVVIGYA